MRGEPFTACKLRRAFGAPIPAGAFLRAKTIGYRVERVAGRTLHCTRWPLTEIPDDALIFDWQWALRTRQSLR